jgi:hypothetical protein
MTWQFNPNNGTWIKELLAFDTWGASIVKLPRDSSIPVTSLETDGEYHEFSIWLKRPRIGGHLFVTFLGERDPRVGRCVYWRPDIESASVSKIIDGTGYLFNFGWKNRNTMPKGQLA